MARKIVKPFPDRSKMDDDEWGELLEEARDKGETVYYWSVDVDGMGGCDGEIVRFRDVFLAFGGDGLDVDPGPFATFEEAIGAGGMTAFGSPPTIWCRLLTDEQILARIEVHEPGPVEVNGQLYDFDPETQRWVPYEDD